jgi:hypothetical protein
MKKPYILILCVGICALSMYAFWPSKPVAPIKATQPVEKREQKKPNLNVPELAKHVPLSPQPALEPIAPQEEAHAPTETKPLAEESDELIQEKAIKREMEMRGQLQDLFNEFEELTMDVESGEYDNDLLDEEIREVVDLMIPMMEQTGKFELTTTTGWTVFRNEDGTYGYGK